MNLSNLPIDNEKDVSLKNLKKIKTKMRSILPKNNNESKFSKNQRKKINSGNKKQIIKIKRRYPENFKCSNCVYSDSINNASWCHTYKRVIIDEHEEALACDLITV